MSNLEEESTSKRSAPDRSMSRAEFCEAEKISLSTYFKMKKAGHGPAEKHFPGMALVRITAKARDEWHKNIEAWNKSKAARLENQRRTLQATLAGELAAMSPLHVSKRNKKPAKPVRSRRSVKG
jgi:hypothetical protein